MHPFIGYARLEPRLLDLWDLCQLASPPTRDCDDDDDETDPADGWCAEDFFYREVKPHLPYLVGLDRREGPPELQTTLAYKIVYAVLLHQALRRPCACCRVEQGANRRV